MPVINRRSRQVGGRILLDIYSLLERDAKRSLAKDDGIFTIINRILLRHYEPDLRKMSDSRAKKPAKKSK